MKGRTSGIWMLVAKFHTHFGWMLEGGLNITPSCPQTLRNLMDIPLVITKFSILRNGLEIEDRILLEAG